MRDAVVGVVGLVQVAAQRVLSVLERDVPDGLDAVGANAAAQLVALQGDAEAVAEADAMGALCARALAFERGQRSVARLDESRVVVTAIVMLLGLARRNSKSRKYRYLTSGLA